MSFNNRKKETGEMRDSETVAFWESGAMRNRGGMVRHDALQSPTFWPGVWKIYLRIRRKNDRGNWQARFITVGAFAASTKYMKRTTLSLICISTLALSAVAQETKPDNTGKNERDRSTETKTSGDQSNSSEDTKITANVRRALVKDSSLTMTAKNVKIVTAGGTVTLRGPVKSAEEKTKIEQLAAAAANGAKIDNQLEIKEPQ
jgi:hyperosmotically inducible protein